MLEIDLLLFLHCRSFLILLSKLGYRQELIEPIVWAHNNFKIDKKTYKFTQNLWDVLFEIKSNSADHKDTDEVMVTNYDAEEYYI